MKLIYKGAEAEIYFNEKRKTVIKKRLPKNYRIKALDEEIRRSRTKKEAKVIHYAKKAGVGAPFIEEVDLKKFTIETSYIDGTRLTELIENAKNETSLKKSLKACYELGKAIAKLHNANIIHGDLTTSNIIVKEKESKKSKTGIFLIDFGLSDFSAEIEDKGVDLVVLKKCLHALNFEIAGKCFKEVLKAYKKTAKEAENVIRRISEIEKRGRYITERG